MKTASRLSRSDAPVALVRCTPQARHTGATSAPASATSAIRGAWLARSGAPAEVAPGSGTPDAIAAPA